MGRKPGLGAAESEVLRYVAKHDSISGREVAEHFMAQRGLTKTTILNVLERLREKGFLKRELEDGIYRYALIESQTTVLSKLVGEFVESILGGSLEPFAAYIAEKEKITDTELARLKEIVQKLEENR